MEILIEPMTLEHYDEVIAVWKETDYVGLSSADERQPIQTYLLRNPGMSFVAKENHRIVGAALCGHDGRRGYLHHLAVKSSHWKRGIGKTLAERCLQSLRREGIRKCHLFVMRPNREGKAFWQKIGWSLRPNIQLVSKEL